MMLLMAVISQGAQAGDQVSYGAGHPQGLAATACVPLQLQVLGRTEHKAPRCASFSHSLFTWAAPCAWCSHSSLRNWVRKQVLPHCELLLCSAHEELNYAQPQCGNS